MKRTRFLIVLVVVVAICAAYSTSGVLAQRGPAGPGRPGGPQGPGDFRAAGPDGPGGPVGPGAPLGPAPNQLPIIKAGNSGVFTILSGNLLKFEATTLKQVGTLALVGKPAEQSDRPVGPPCSGEMLIAGGTNDAAEKVVVVLGKQVIVVDAASFKVTGKVALPDPPKPADAGDGQVAPPMPMGPAPLAALELHGQTLYILRGAQLVAVNLTSNTVIAQGTLPKPEAPASQQ